jgi:hypothetical protein
MDVWRSLRWQRKAIKHVTWDMSATNHALREYNPLQPGSATGLHSFPTPVGDKALPFPLALASSISRWYYAVN